MKNTTPMDVAKSLLQIARWTEQECERVWRSNPRNEAREREWVLASNIRESIEKAIEYEKDRCSRRSRFVPDLGGTGGD